MWFVCSPQHHTTKEQPMKELIPEFLKQEFLKYRSDVENFPSDVRQFMVEYSKFHSWGFDHNLKKIFAVMKLGISDLPICGLEGCDEKVNFKHYLELAQGCCREHSQKISFLRKYGTTNPMCDATVKNKQKNTMFERYGVEHPLQNTQIQKKSEQSCVEKYGVSHPMKNIAVQQKVKESTKKKYGVDHIFQNVETKEKIQKWRKNNAAALREKSKQTMMKKFGVEYPMQSTEIVKKMKCTMLEKYGVEHNMQSPTLFKKNQKAMYKHKEYTWKTGEISVVQGHEPIVLQELEEKGYNFTDVKTDESDMPEIWYFFENEKHRYYPDLFIPAENLVIEVKSVWTLQLHWDKNQAKFAAVRELGFNFKLEIR